VTIRTMSAYFSPKNAIAPAATACSYGTDSHVTGRGEKTTRFTSSSTAESVS